MIVVRVELHSAVTGKVSEIARAIIYNDGTGTSKRGNYTTFMAPGVLKGDTMNPIRIHMRKRRESKVLNYPRASKHVWNLVARCLSAMGYK